MEWGLHVHASTDGTHAVYLNPGTGPARHEHRIAGPFGTRDEADAAAGEVYRKRVEPARDLVRALEAERDALPHVEDNHRQVVADALAAGKPVPAEVLADYPDLAAKVPPPSTGAPAIAPVPPATIPAPPPPETADARPGPADPGPADPGPGGPGPVPGPVGGPPDGGGAGGPPGPGGGEPARPRVVTAREGLTRIADPALVPESLRGHLTPAQQQGTALAIDAMQKHGGFLLADGTGVGKTRTQLATARHFADAGKKVVIVSPAEVIKPDWKKGTAAGSFAHDGAVMGVTPELTKGDAGLKPGTVHLTTYNELGKLKDHVDKDTVLIFDESHFLKNRDSARHKHGKEAMDKAAAVMYATATPGDKPLHTAHLFRAGVFGNQGGDPDLRTPRDAWSTSTSAGGSTARSGRWTRRSGRPSRPAACPGCSTR